MLSNTAEPNREPLLPEKTNTLNGEQINYAWELIDARHKLKATPWRVTWPFIKWMCCCFLKKRKRSFNLGLKRAIRRKLEISVPKSDLRLEEDPFLLLGYGMNSYFEVMVELMIMTVVVCLVMVPLMFTYSSFNALESMPGYDWNQYTLGNIGGSDTFCAQSGFGGQMSAFSVECPAGTEVNLTQKAENTGAAIFDAGIIPSTAEINTYCMNSAFEDSNNCSSYLKLDALTAALNTECVGEQTCQITKLNQYVDKTGAPVDSPCFESSAQMFLQVGCTIPVTDTEKRQEKGLALSCAAVFVALFVINFIDFIKKVQQNNYVEWDVKTITAGDFSIEFDIDPTFFSDYMEKKHDDWIEASAAEGRTYMSRVQAFQFWIQREMESRLDRLPDLGYEGEPVEHISVAVTTLAFKNAEMINLLRQRGAAIKAEKWDIQKQLEDKINEQKNSEFETMCSPCSVFMTFESEEGVNRALSYHEAVDADTTDSLTDLKTWLGDHEIEIQQASEPSDIIWENRHFTPGQRTRKECVVGLVMFFMLFISFILIFICSNVSAKALNKYPVIADCEASLIGYDNDVFMQQSAILEYKTNTALEAKGKTVSYAGYTQCFCNDQAEDGAEPDKEYGPKKVKVCEDYFDSQFTTLVLTNSITGIIVAINYLLKTFTIMLITWIGYDTHSVLMTKITNGVFIALFFNTGILLILTNANLADVSGLLSNIFSGTYYDYSPQWYATVGSVLVSTMWLNAFMPPIYEGITNGTAWLFQTMDNGWRCCKKKEERIYHTKTTQIYQYLDLYTGPDYIVHYKYSGILNVTYVTMLYGLGLPALFPIAFLSFFIFWATERYQIAYTYQLPPAMDDTMTKNALKLLSYTPIMFLMNGYWMLSNKQMFENVINSVTFSTEQMSSAHGWSSLGNVDQATPMLMICLLLFVVTLMQILFYDTLSKWGFTISSNVIEVDENLPEFFSSVKLSDADWLVKESNYLKDQYGFTFANRKVVERLDNWQVAKKPISGIAWYNLLANPAYVRSFSYIQVDVPQREDLIVDGDSDEGNDCEQSDMVSILVNLAYVKREVARTFKFGPGYSTSFKQEMDALK